MRGTMTFGQALKIEYVIDYPTFDLSDDTEDRSLLPLVTKSTHWSYEDEFRLIAQDKRLWPSRV